MKLTTIHSGINFSLHLSDKESFFAEDARLRNIIFFVFGLIGAFLIYAFIAAIITRYTSYAFYGLYFFTFVFQQFWYLGFARFYFPLEWGTILTATTSIQISLLFITWTFFAISFLEIKPGSKIYKIYALFVIAGILEAVIFSFVHYHNSMIISMATGSLYLLYSVFVAVYIYMLKRSISSLYYMIGHLVSFAFYFLIVLDATGCMFITEYVPYLLLSGLTIEALILMVALLANYNKLQQTESMQKMQIEEINHRVNNNLAIMISLINKEIYVDRNDIVKESFIKLKNRIYALSHAYSLLTFDKEDIVTNPQKYIQDLVENLKESLSIGNDKEIALDIDVVTWKLKTMEALGLILNELITNFFKYNQQTKGILNISIKPDGSDYVMRVEDNGEGFVIRENNASNGIKIIKGLVSSRLKGSISMDTEHGAKYLIRWKR